MKNIETTDKEQLLLIRLLFNHIEKMRKTIGKYGQETMVEDIEPYERLLNKIEG